MAAAWQKKKPKRRRPEDVPFPLFLGAVIFNVVYIFLNN